MFVDFLLTCSPFAMIGAFIWLIFFMLFKDYCAYYGVAHSKCYTDYGLVRTGCVGCPFGKRIGDEMSVLSQYEPRLYKAALAVFGKSYDYTQKYMDYRNKRKAEYKNIKEKL